jgi:hypothetical protein
MHRVNLNKEKEQTAQDSGGKARADLGYGMTKAANHNVVFRLGENTTPPSQVPDSTHR